MRKLGQFCRPGDDIVEIRRLALNRHPDGGIIWQPPFSFDMSPGKGYWRRNIIPRLEAGAERQGYALALEKVIGKCTGKGRGRGKGLLNSTVGASNKDLFPPDRETSEKRDEHFLAKLSEKSWPRRGNVFRLQLSRRMCQRK